MLHSKIRIVVLLLLILSLIVLLLKKSEGWIPMVWNIPTREIYPPLYYDLRCPPPVYHYYRRTTCPTDVIYLDKPLNYYNMGENCPYDF
jgi:hypothetical protein